MRSEVGTTSLLFTLPNLDNQYKRGVLDIKVDSAFASNRRFYLTYSQQALLDTLRINLAGLT